MSGRVQVAGVPASVAFVAEAQGASGEDQTLQNRNGKSIDAHRP